MSVLESENNDNGEKFVKAVIRLSKTLIYTAIAMKYKDYLSKRSEKEAEHND